MSKRLKKTTIKVHAIKGRGVFAEEAIRNGETIEICQIILVNRKEIGDTLEGYVFDFDARRVAVALGNGSLYNHSDHFNAQALMDDEEKLLYFEALRPIKKGEEITINYGYSKADRKKFNLI